MLNYFGMELEREEVAEMSRKTAFGLAGTAVLETTGLAALVGSAAFGLGAAASLGTVLGEVVGRGLAEYDLPKEYKTGYANVFSESGAAVAKDVKWFVGKVADVVLDIPLPGGAAVMGPWVEKIAERHEIGKRWDKFVGIEEHQASATTAAADYWSERKEEFKEGFRNKLASFRGAKAGSEPVAAHTAPTMKV